MTCRCRSGECDPECDGPMLRAEIDRLRLRCDALGNEREALRNALQVMIGEEGLGLSYSERCTIVAKALNWVSAPS